MKRLEIVQIGMGNVGRAVAQVILEQRKHWLEDSGLDVRYRAVADTSGALVGEDLLPQAIRIKEEGGHLSELGVEPVEDVLLSEPEPDYARAVVDLAVHGGTYDLDLLGVQNGAFLVLSNKGPLSGSMDQYRRFTTKLRDRLWREATVGAGMPIISTLQGLIEGGDEVFEIQASPSGTLGFIMSAVEGGRSFSEAVKEAVDLHYAEPDPRDDLSGLDVARKAIILARTMGRDIEPDEVPIPIPRPRRPRRRLSGGAYATPPGGRRGLSPSGCWPSRSTTCSATWPASRKRDRSRSGSWTPRSRAPSAR